MSRKNICGAGLVALLLCMTGCGPLGGTSESGIANVTFAIEGVTSDVRCVRVDMRTAKATLSLWRDIGVDDEARLEASNVTVGAVAIQGFAFDGPCAHATVPTWGTGEVSLVLSPGVRNQVVLALRPWPPPDASSPAPTVDAGPPSPDAAGDGNDTMWPSDAQADTGRDVLRIDASLDATKDGYGGDAPWVDSGGGRPSKDGGPADGYAFDAASPGCTFVPCTEPKPYSRPGATEWYCRDGVWAPLHETVFSGIPFESDESEVYYWDQGRIYAVSSTTPRLVATDVPDPPIEGRLSDRYVYFSHKGGVSRVPRSGQPTSSATLVGTNSDEIGHISGDDTYVYTLKAYPTVTNWEVWRAPLDGSAAPSLWMKNEDDSYKYQNLSFAWYTDMLFVTRHVMGTQWQYVAPVDLTGRDEPFTQTVLSVASSMSPPWFLAKTSGRRFVSNEGERCNERNAQSLSFPHVFAAGGSRCGDIISTPSGLYYASDFLTSGHTQSTQIVGHFSPSGNCTIARVFASNAAIYYQKPDTLAYVRIPFPGYP